jgi:outer membrane biosynthesis protein TonB
MNRIHKKCVLISVGLHLSLLALIFVGPGFTGSKPAEAIREIDFTPTIVTAENIAGGGNPNARPPAAVVTPKPAPPQPQPQPQPKPVETPKDPPPKPEQEERTEKVKARDPDPDPDDFSERKARKPHITTTPVTRHASSDKKSTSNAQALARQRQAAQARRALAQEFARAAESIRDGSASATAIDDDFGPGGGGPAYAGYDSLVQKRYQDAWVKPSDTSSDSPVTYATVTIARDGSVVPGSARIIERSGDSQMDSSVQRTLDRVTTMGMPFPEGIKEKQRTYKLKFDLQKRRLT